jgi:hypothetical protein
MLSLHSLYVEIFSMKSLFQIQFYDFYARILFFFIALHYMTSTVDEFINFFYPSSLFIIKIYIRIIITISHESGQIAVFFWLTGRSKNRNSPSEKISTSQENTSLFQSNPNSVNQLDLVRIPSLNSIDL